MIDPAARGAWQELENKLRPFISRRVRSSSDVEDVMQEVLLRMHRGFGALRDDDRFGPWVYQIARNAITDHLRVSARHPVPERELDVEAAAELAPEEQEDSEARRALLACLVPFIARLPVVYREALTLTELEGVRQRDAAEMLGTSLTALKSRVQRGRARLRAELEGCCAIALDARGGPVTCEPRSSCDAGCGRG